MLRTMSKAQTWRSAQTAVRFGEEPLAPGPALAWRIMSGLACLAIFLQLALGLCTFGGLLLVGTPREPSPALRHVRTGSHGQVVRRSRGPRRLPQADLRLIRPLDPGVRPAVRP